MVAKLETFKNCIPCVNPNPTIARTIVYWHTCFIRAALIDRITKEQFYNDCCAFVKYLIDARNRCLNVTSDFAINEVLFLTLKKKIEPIFKDINDPQYKDKDWTSYLKDHRNIFDDSVKQQVEEDFQKVQERLQILPSRNGKFYSRDAVEIIMQHKLLPTDAYHIAFAKSYNISNIATLDYRDFKQGCDPMTTIYSYYHKH